LRVVDVGGDDGPAPRHLVPDDLEIHALAQGDELHLGGDLTAPGVVELGDGAPGGGPQAGRVGGGTGERLGARTPGPERGPAVVAQAGHPPGVVLDVAPLVDPTRPQRCETGTGIAPRAA